MKLLFCFLSVIIFSSVYAQSNYQITGTVLDENNKPIDLAIVGVFNSSDSTLIKSEYTDQDGTYLLTNISAGKYLLQVKHYSYKHYEQAIEVNNSLTLETINLTTKDVMLDDITVDASTPYVVRMVDRTVITPDALIAGAGSNALEVLEQAPGVTVDQNGSIILKGRAGVAVFINDKPSYLSGADLENYLKSLPAGSIKNIEIIENPPAKYEAAGNAGIININIKRSTVKGLYGNTSISYRRSRYNGSNNSLNLNYNKNKVSVYTNLYGGFWENFQDLNINRYYLDADNSLQSSFKQNSFNNRSGYYLNGKIGVDFYPTDNTILGISYKRSTSPDAAEIDNTSLVSDSSGTLIQKVVADNLSESTFQNQLVSFYITQTLDTLGSELSLDVDYVQYKSSNDQVFQNFQYDAADALTFQNQINGEIPSQINIFAVKTDYTKPLKGASRIDAGLKSAFTKTDNEAIYSTTVGGVTAPNYNLSNRFLYDEWINAAYVNYSKSWDRIDLQLGLRGEATKLKGNQLGNPVVSDTSFTRNYASLFPTLYATARLDSAGVHGLNFSYGRRIERPYFQDLNPFISPLDQFTFYTGNPNLLPTFSHNLSLTYSYNNMVNTSLSYAKTIDGINETLEIQDGIYYSRPGNIASSQYLSLSVDGTFKITSWYSINSYAEVAAVRFDSQLYTEQLNSKGVNVYLSATNSFRLKKGWRMSLSGRYLNNHVYSQLLIKGYAVLNLGIQKNILDGRGSLRLSANDLLYSRRGDGVINNLRQTDADWNSKFDSQSVTVAFSLRFGKSTSDKRKYKGSGSDSEQNRVRG